MVLWAHATLPPPAAFARLTRDTDGQTYKTRHAYRNSPYYFMTYFLGPMSTTVSVVL